MTKQEWSKDTSIRYHLHCIGVILSNRIFVALDKYKAVIIAFSIGVGVGLIVGFPWNSVSHTTYQQPTSTPSLVVLNSTDKEIVDTDLFGDLSVGYNFTGRTVPDNKPVTTFECSIDGRQYESCEPPMKPALTPGNHTFEVRAMLANGTVDPTPAVSLK